MAKKFYTLQLVEVENANGDICTEVPVVFQTEEGVSWREAKKALRQWYLKEAAACRALREKDVLVEEAATEWAEKAHAQEGII